MGTNLGLTNLDVNFMDNCGLMDDSGIAGKVR